MTAPNEPRDLTTARSRAERDIDDELSFHRERTIAEFVAQGLTPAEAQALATRRFGSLQSYRRRLIRLRMKQSAQEKRRATMQIFATSARAVARGVLGSPGFTLGVIAILTLGLGVNVVTFGLVDRLILGGPAGVAEPDLLRRVVVHKQTASPIERSKSGGAIATMDLAYLDYRDALGARQLAGAAAESATPLLVGRGETAEIVQGRLVTANYFALLGVSPAIGRFFTTEESERDGVRLVVLSHAFWQRRFAANPDAIGRLLEIESNTYTVVGVTPRNFTGSAVSKVDVFLPLEASADVQVSGPWRASRSFSWVAVLVRLAPASADGAAKAELSALFTQARDGTKDADPQARVTLEPLNALRGAAASNDVSVAALLWGVAILVLAIAAANVANLFLARSLRRQDHLAIRLALGAGRARIVAEQAVEGALLALVGAAVAVLVALAGAPALQRLLFPQVEWLDSTVNLRGLMVAAGFAIIGGSFAAAMPAWRTGRVDVVDGLRSGGQRVSRTRTPTQTAMLVVQGALSVVLLVGAGLFVNSLRAAQSQDLGIDANRLMVVSVAPGETATRLDFQDALRARIGLIRGVDGTTLAAGTVSFVSSWAEGLAVPGLDVRPRVDDGGPYLHAVEPGYFELAGTEILEGRVFGPEDRAGAERVAIVNRTMARLYWPGESALGKCLRIGPRETRCSIVVGVVENARRQAIVEGDSLLYYMPLEQAPDNLRRSPRLLVRTSDDDEATMARVSESIRQAALALEPGLRLVRARPLEEIISPQLRAWRLGAGLFSAFGVLALVVAAVGLYAVIAFDVEGRRREMGVRAALGASGAAILRLVVGDGLRLTAGGLAVGLALAWLLAPLIEGLLYNVPPQDVRVFAVATLVLVAAALVASAIPARRAARVDPSQALRSE